MHITDWLIVGLYILIALGVGWYYRNRAQESMESYFTGGRNIPGWLIGTSMVATTFAADTPLVVTGIVAKNGIAGNWFWWSFAISHVLAAFLFAPFWRRAEIITDAELVEIRYSGKAATWLRSSRAFMFAIPINCIIMGWVIRAMGKIVSVLLPWDQWLPAEFYAALVEDWPSWLAIGTPSEAISIILAVGFATCYASLGGLRSVIMTDFLQFGFAMVGSIALALFAVQEIGGLDAIPDKLANIYGSESHDILSFFPQGDSKWLPLETFLVYLLVQWWAQKFSDGGGIIVQRMSAAKDEAHAIGGTSWFVIAHYALRPWPWILVGLASLIIFPKIGELGLHPMQSVVLADREMAYPILMQELLPVGLLGIMVTGMLAAFMSTIDTHITWGASYLASDFYRRLIRPDANDQELVKVSRYSVIVMVVLSLIATSQISTIENAWKFVTVLGSGLGLVTILRWVWWRITAWSELAGLSISVVLAILLYGTPLGELLTGGDYGKTLLLVVSISTMVVLGVTFLGPQESITKLEEFYARVKPYGFWGPITESYKNQGHRLLPKAMLNWCIGTVFLFLTLFGIGTTLLNDTILGLTVTTTGIFGWIYCTKIAIKQSRLQTSTPPAQKFVKGHENELVPATSD
ncbi:MAG: sodium:solute symporter family protein [Myxococcota bacterium]|nr:sodium:solute symporter family protein [Myxococcota bacterium]